jgi:hypothetical protein
MRNCWSLKALHREMMLSAVYRQSSGLRIADFGLRIKGGQVDASLNPQSAIPNPQSIDPDNRLLSRMPLRRVEAEVLRDALLTVSGQLDDTPFGPPDDVDVRGDGLVTPKRSSSGWRRSIYVLHRRTKLPTLLENFDSPQMGPNCIERGESIVAPQALHLLNNKSVHELAGDFAERVRQEVGAEPSAQVIRVHQLAFGTRPSEAELRTACADLQQLTQHWQTALGAGADAPFEAAHRALQNYCHAIMNSAAFVYVD